MTKYYFFKTVRVNGFQKLRALGGQKTYINYQNRHGDVDTQMDVQTSRESRTIQASLPDGTIFCAVLEGGREYDVRLRVHSRNGQNHYRLEGAETCPLFDVEGRRIINGIAERFAATDAMAEAWVAYVANVGASLEGRRDTAQSAPTSAGTVFDRMRLARLSDDELIRMVQYTERGKVAKMSWLRDKMQTFVVKFVFRKQNGDLRTAYGTRSRDIISTIRENDSVASTEHSEPTGEYFFYFDIQRQDWRKFCVDGFVSLDEDAVFSNPEEITMLRNLPVEG